MNVTVSIDRLTIIGDIVKERFEETIKNNHYGFIVRKGIAKYPYHSNFYMTDGSILQWTDVHTHRALRYDFNPNKIIKDKKENIHRRSVFDIIKTMKYPEFSRIDIAIDIRNVDLSQYQVIFDKSFKRNYWENGSRRLETLYLGSPKSSYRIRIYDKRLEQKSDDDMQWWRVEIQLRGEKVQEFMKHMNSFCIFNHLKFAKLPIQDIEDIQTRSMIYYLLNNPSEWNHISKNTKTKYKKIISELSKGHEIDIDELYKAESLRIRKELLLWLRIAERNNII